ncbi:hypothetical protein JB92DRAFT_2659855, partial [Gautieria morchelliformis]
VRVVQHKQTRDLYALKYIKMEAVGGERGPALVSVVEMAGIDVLPQMDHPFVVSLRYAFQDDGNCFSVLDLILGRDLR